MMMMMMMMMLILLQTADTISYLALQRPLDVAVKLVDCGVQSRGHSDCIIKLLSRLPTLAKITTTNGRCALLDRLDQQIVSSSPQTLQNVAYFCRLLLVSRNNASVSNYPLLSDIFCVFICPMEAIIIVFVLLVECIYLCWHHFFVIHYATASLKILEHLLSGFR